jgi:glycosyltransferase involved in cell wall biosynthesis
MSPQQQNRHWIVYVSTFPPRQCGIATFTTDLTNAINKMFEPSIKSKIIAMKRTEVSHYSYPDKVIAQISQPSEKDYVVVADKLNRLEKVKLVNIQHEFGIFGGENGSHILLFLEKIQKPVVVTLHTVLPAPDKGMRNVVQAIVKYSKGIIVMTHYSKEILERDYGVEPNRIQVIPHGIHHVPYRSTKNAKFALGFSGKLVLSTIGFLSPGKGIEYVIEALPPVVRKFPNVRYLIAGVSHPLVVKQEGESYRNSLVKRVYELGLGEYVLFNNTYYDLHDLLEFLAATDIYLSTSLDPDQTVSGTLSYALGSGCPVISTAFAQARENITDDVGILVDFKNPQAFTDAIIELLVNDQLRLQMGGRSYLRTRCSTWQNVALSYVKYFSQFVPELTLLQRELPRAKLTHLAKLTDNFGIIQFAEFDEPDYSSGYTLDDNARALVAAALDYKQHGTSSSLRLVSIYLDFLYRVSKPDGYFDNYVNPNHTIDEQRNHLEYSEDASARGLYALAQVSTTKQIPERLRKRAHSLLEQSFRNDIAFSSARAIASYIKALASLLSRWEDARTLAALEHHCEKLMALYEKNHSRDWEWFEPCLTYSNALLPEALLLGYRITDERKYLEVSEKTLNFLINHTFKDNMYIPIGQNGWFPKGGTRQYFDQQPEDVAATVIALNAMFRVTNEKHYRELAYKAFNWFLGDNILGQVVYDRTTGGCYDGLGEKFVNLNQGAESTISCLLARFSFDCSKSTKISLVTNNHRLPITRLP